MFSNDLPYRALLVANCEFCEVRALQIANFANCDKSNHSWLIGHLEADRVLSKSAEFALI